MPSTLPETFIRERQYIKGVTSATVIWYRSSFKAFSGCGLEQPSADTVKAVKNRIAELARDHKAISINTWLRTINAYLHWCHTEEHVEKRYKIPRVKEPQYVIQPFDQAQITALVRHKPATMTMKRVHALALLILDSGIRVQEGLNLKRSDINLDDLLITVLGKGRKQRVIPISPEGRRLMVRHLRSHEHEMVFCTRSGAPLSQRNASRDFKTLCRRAGIDGVRTSWHTLRHSFALSYIRNGGDAFSLMRILGHTTLAMTKRYVNLQTEDLKSKHAQHARLLAGGR